MCFFEVQIESFKNHHLKVQFLNSFSLWGNNPTVQEIYAFSVETFAISISG